MEHGPRLAARGSGGGLDGVRAGNVIAFGMEGYKGKESVVVVAEVRADDPDEVRELFRSLPGILVVDEPENDVYPTAQSVKDTDPVYVGRIRRAPSSPNGLLMWVVADNLRKGAATNAVQILEFLTT